MVGKTLKILNKVFSSERVKEVNLHENGATDDYKIFELKEFELRGFYCTYLPSHIISWTVDVNGILRTTRI